MDYKAISDDAALRPTSLSTYGGQDHVKTALELYILAAKMREEILDHCIIHGPSGSGKTTLANFLSNEMNMEIEFISAPGLRSITDLTKILLELGPNKILFIDEIHRLNTRLQEILYFAMEDFFVVAEITDEEGIVHANAKVEIPKFTCVGATTHIGLLTEPMRNRFGIECELYSYKEEDICSILAKSAEKLNTSINKESCLEIARRSRGIPRTANSFLRRVRDFAMVKNHNVIDKNITDLTFTILDIDEFGLTRSDRNYLNTILTKFGGVAGLETLCSALNSTKVTLENVIEPYLLQSGFISKTSRGRMITEFGRKYLMLEKVS